LVLTVEIEYKFAVLEEDVWRELNRVENWWELLTNLRDEMGSPLLAQPRFKNPMAMASAYYDTETSSLSAVRAVLRQRREDDRVLLTFKMDMPCERADGLHRRREFEITLDEWTEPPPISRFIETWKDFRDTVSEAVFQSMSEPLICRYSAAFERRVIILECADAVVEVALDRGVLRNLTCELPFMEIELELMSGGESDLHRLTRAVSERFQVVPESISKLGRCIALDHSDFADNIIQPHTAKAPIDGNEVKMKEQAKDEHIDTEI
jgi:inorganic triphosphatase YgiF